MTDLPVDYYETRKVAVMKWVERPADIAKRTKEAQDAELWQIWKDAHPDRVISSSGALSCSRNHMDHMPGVVDEEYCGTCGTDLGIPPFTDEIRRDA